MFRKILIYFLIKDKILLLFFPLTTVMEYSKIFICVITPWFATIPRKKLDYNQQQRKYLK